MGKTYDRPAGLVYGPDARQLMQEGRGASLGGLSATAYTLVEMIERNGGTITRRFETGTLPRETMVPACLPPGLMAKWRYLAAESAELGRRDRSSVYGGFHVFERDAAY